MSKPEIATREEVLAMLTENARKGQTGAMIALERALRVTAKEEDSELDRELDPDEVASAASVEAVSDGR